MSSVVRELADDIDIKVYADFPREISERRKSSGHVSKKQERRERLLSLANQNPINCDIGGRFVPL